MNTGTQIIATADKRDMEVDEIVTIAGVDCGPLRVTRFFMVNDWVYIDLLDSNDRRCALEELAKDVQYRVEPEGTALGPC